MPDRDMVQIRITAPGKHMLPEGYVRQGKVLWVSKANAHQYINVLKIAEPAGAGVGPDETKPAGPGETKPAAASQAKSSSGAPDGRSTASPKSGAHGTVASSSVSQPDRVSTTVRSPRSPRGANKEEGDESSS